MQLPENSSKPSASSLPDILRCICNDKALSLFKAVAVSSNDCSKILITKLRLTRKQYYIRIKELMHTGLVRRISGKYSLTSLGKVVFGMLTKIETAIKYYWKLKGIDSIMMTSANTNLPSEEYQRIIDTLIDNEEIKTVLASNNNNFESLLKDCYSTH
jgi:predicted transcriptional regulator